MISISRFALLLFIFSFCCVVILSEAADEPQETRPLFRCVFEERESSQPLLRAIPGTWEAEWFGVEYPLRRGDRTYLYYRGSDKGNRNTQLGLAISEDGVHWRRHPANPIWVQAWDYFLRDVRVYDFDEERLWMFYSDGDKHIDLAFSTDGIHWENYEQNPLFSVTQEWEFHVMQPSVVKRDGKWYMLYSSYGGGKPRVSGLATSDDGIHWEKHPANPVLELGRPGEWDDYSAFQPTVFYEDGFFHMLYTGSDEKNRLGYRWGYAWSRDGIHWTKSPDNPVFEPASPGAWDAGKVSTHSLLRTGPGSFYVYYSGAPSPTSTYIGIGRVQGRLVRDN